MRPARCICVLRPAAQAAAQVTAQATAQAAAQAAAQATAQAAARKLQRAGRMVCYVRVRANTQHASEIAENMFNSVRPAACGLRQSMNQSSQLTHSTFHATCGKV